MHSAALVPSIDLPASAVTIAETRRVRLRTWTGDDVAPYAAVVADPVVMRHIGDGQPRGEERAAREVAGFVRAQLVDGFSRWVVERRSDGAFLGFIGPMRTGTYIDYGARAGRAHWGCGLAVDAVTLALEAIFVTCGIERIVAVTRLGNSRAWRMNGRMGFVEVGQVEQQGHPCLIQDLDRDTYLGRGARSANLATLDRFLRRTEARHVGA